jgi:hypothetical protein
MAGALNSFQSLDDLAQRAFKAEHGANFRVEKIANGYLVHCVTGTGAVAHIYYAEDARAAGERIAAMLVASDVKGESK